MCKTLCKSGDLSAVPARERLNREFARFYLGERRRFDVPLCLIYKDKLRKIVGDLEAKFNENNLTWDEFYSFQLMLLPMYPDAELRGKRATLPKIIPFDPDSASATRGGHEGHSPQRPAQRRGSSSQR